MALCPRCGEDNAESSRYCSSCGTLLVSEAGGLSAERRLITAVFVDLVDFTSRAEELDPEEVGRILRLYHERARSELERFGGRVEKYIGDAVVALFGVPVVHEDDPERAVRAAFAVRDAIEELNASDPASPLRLRIGVNTGEALVELGASLGAGELTAAGDVLNTCARLEEAAPTGGILVGEETYRATWAPVEYRPVDPVRVKGKRQRLRAWEAVAVWPVGGLPDRTRLSPFVGRDRLLESLLEMLGEVRSGPAPRSITLLGEPGLGKTRLVRELSAAAAEGKESLHWLRGRCLPYGEGISYWALGEIVKGEAGILETDPADRATDKLERTLSALFDNSETASWVGSWLRPLLGLSSEEQLGGDRRGEAFAAWRRFFEALAARGLLVLVVEDLQWADDGLLDFLDFLMSSAVGAPLALFCTTRPELLEQRPEWPGIVEVLPLHEVESSTLLDALLGRGALPDDVRSAVLAQTAGNPLFLEEYARMLGDLERGGELPGGKSLSLPQSVQAIIAARLDRLPPQARSVVQDAAVVGTTFWAGALSHVGRRSKEDVGNLLAELAERQLVFGHADSTVAGESEYAFGHVLVKEVAYAQIPRSRRAEKHRATAEWIETVASDRAQDLAELLAHHYRSAIEYAQISGAKTTELDESARLALRAAGDRALGLNAFGAAAAYYRDALELWPASDADRADLLFRLGRALFWAESSGEDVLLEASEALLVIGDQEAAADAEVMRSRLALARGDPEAIEVARKAAELIHDSPASRSKGDALSNLARFLELAGRAEEAIEVGRQALELADQLDLEELRAHALFSLGSARTGLGDLDGIADLERSIAITDQLNSPESVRGYANLASLLANLGHLERAWSLYAEAREIAERFGEVRGLRWLSVELAFEHYWRGDWDDALDVAQALLAEVEAGGERYMAHGCWHVRSCIRAARGEEGGALDDSARALELARRLGDPQILYPSLARRARVLTDCGSRDEAAGLCNELLLLWTRGGFHLASFWTADLSYVLLGLGRGAELSDRAPKATPATVWLDAACHFVAGRHSEAADVYARIGALPEEATARAEAARNLAASGRRAAAEGERARALAFYHRVDAEASARKSQLSAAPA